MAEVKYTSDSRPIIGRPPVHGHAVPGNRTYATWNQMRMRCENPKTECFPDYGGRGIRVCDRWLKFENFLADMGERPEGMSLDRFPDSNGNYEPGNCRWATAKEQANNRRNNVYIEFEGQKLTITQWSEKIGISIQVISHRVKKGWPIEKILDPRVGRHINRN